MLQIQRTFDLSIITEGVIVGTFDVVVMAVVVDTPVVVFADVVVFAEVVVVFGLVISNSTISRGARG